MIKKFMQVLDKFELLDKVKQYKIQKERGITNGDI